MVPRANATRGLRSFPVVLRVTCVLALLVVTWIPVTEAVICRDSYKCNCTGIKGGAGYPGIPGLQGPEGPPGDIGPDGPPGPKGEKGAGGEYGGMGEKGYRGEQGIQGFPGAAGLPGKPGSPGVMGPVHRGYPVSTANAARRDQWEITGPSANLATEASIPWA